MQVITGDFNIDNVEDTTLFVHPLFTEYVDYGRIGPGVEQPWCGQPRRKQ